MSLWLIFWNMVLAGLSAVGGAQGTIAAAQASWVGPGLLSPESFAWAVALGQITPGPLSVLVVALGWQLRGPAGAAVALLGVALPTFLASALAARGLDRWRERLQPFTRAIPWLVASLALVAAIRMVIPLKPGLLEGLGIVAGAALVGAGKLEPYWLIIAGALAGGVTLLI